MDALLRTAFSPPAENRHFLMNTVLHWQVYGGRPGDSESGFGHNPREACRDGLDDTVVLAVAWTVNAGAPTRGWSEPAGATLSRPHPAPRSGVGVVARAPSLVGRDPSGTLPSFDIEAKYPISICGRYRIPNLRY